MVKIYELTLLFLHMQYVCICTSVHFYFLCYSLLFSYVSNICFVMLHMSFHLHSQMLLISNCDIFTAIALWYWAVINFDLTWLNYLGSVHPHLTKTQQFTKLWFLQRTPGVSWENKRVTNSSACFAWLHLCASWHQGTSSCLRHHTKHVQIILIFLSKLQYLATICKLTQQQWGQAWALKPSLAVERPGGAGATSFVCAL